MGRIDHVKLSKPSQGMAQGSNNATYAVAVFPVHIQYFYNLP